ncbi:MAG: hypothetical protein ACK53V_05155 [Planctomycetota bacterium]
MPAELIPPRRNEWKIQSTRRAIEFVGEKSILFRTAPDSVSLRDRNARQGNESRAGRAGTSQVNAPIRPGLRFMLNAG